MTEDHSILHRDAREPDEQLRYGDHADQVIDVWRAAGHRPLLVFVHGGFWRPDYDRTHARPLGAALADEGWPVASLEYRREPGQPEVTTSDIAAALDRLPDLMDLPAGFVLIGHSAGGHLALWAAATYNPVRLRAVVALAPVADLLMADHLRLGDGAVRDFLGPVARNELDPVHLPASIAPVAIVHGTRDDQVPISLSESFVTAHPTARLLPVEGAGHYDVIDPRSEAWRRLVTELTALTA